MVYDSYHVVFERRRDMQNIIFLSSELQAVLDSKASTIGITTPAFITDFLTESFKDE